MNGQPSTRRVRQAPAVLLMAAAFTAPSLLQVPAASAASSDDIYGSTEGSALVVTGSRSKEGPPVDGTATTVSDPFTVTVEEAVPRLVSRP